MLTKAEDVLVELLNLDAEIDQCKAWLSEAKQGPPDNSWQWGIDSEIALHYHLANLNARREAEFVKMNEALSFAETHRA